MGPGARELADRTLASYGVTLPDEAADVEVERVDFEAPGWLIEDATLIAFDVPRSAMEPMLDWQTTGLYFATNSTVGRILAPSVSDMIGESLDLDTPAVDTFVPSVDPAAEDRSIAVAMPPGDPTRVTLLIYELPG